MSGPVVSGNQCAGDEKKQGINTGFRACNASRLGMNALALQYQQTEGCKHCSTNRQRDASTAVPTSLHALHFSTNTVRLHALQY